MKKEKKKYKSGLKVNDMYSDFFDFDANSEFKKPIETITWNNQIAIPVPMDELTFDEWFSCN